MKSSPEPAAQRICLENIQENIPCPVCLCPIALVQADAHVNAHLDVFEDAQAGSASSATGQEQDFFITCQAVHCQQRIPAAEIDAHMSLHDEELAQQLQNADAGMNQADQQLARQLQCEEEYRAATLSRRSHHREDEALARQLQMKEQQQQQQQARQQVSPVTSKEHQSLACSAASDPPSKNYGADEQAVACGLIPLLRHAFEAQESDPRRRGCSEVVLAGEQDLFAQNWVDGDWSCGYRNIQMLCSRLKQLPEYAGATFFGGLPAIPPIACVQEFLERAWGNGFDLEGADQLGNRLQGTHKWIGTTECCALLRFFGVRAKIVDFRGTGAEGETHQALVDWVWRYFTSGGHVTTGARIVISQRPPLYFQHDGHSRTIVGIEKRWLTRRTDTRAGGPVVNLVIFDPGTTSRKYRLSLEQGGWEKRFKRGIHTLRMREYQILYCDGVMTAQEQAVSKFVEAAETYSTTVKPGGRWKLGRGRPPVLVPGAEDAPLAVHYDTHGRPNHFISIRITQRELRQSLLHIQQQMTAVEPRLKQGCRPVGSWHLTLGTLLLETPQQHARVQHAFEQFGATLHSMLPSHQAIQLQTIGTCHGTLVARLSPADEALLRALSAELLSHLQQAGIATPGNNKPYSPHVTLIRISPLLPDDVRTALAAVNSAVPLGSQPVDALHLCAISSDRTLDSFYPRVACLYNRSP